MQPDILKDLFFDKQPSLEFVEQLKQPVHIKKPACFGKGVCQLDEIDVSGICLVRGDFNVADLETVFRDFSDFTGVYQIAGDRYPVRLLQEYVDGFESFKIEVTPAETRICANDTEGIRRGIIWLEDAIISAEGPFLKLGVTQKTPQIKTRITRGFFSPTNRPPHNVDELYNETDYYPDNYLSRLMHDGVNGIWIYTKFCDLLPSSYIEEYGKESEMRIQKLNRVIEKCGRYGIGVYILSVEPQSFWNDENMRKKYIHTFGADAYGNRKALCLQTDLIKNYIEEAGQLLVKLVPRLKGWISITAGERLTHCMSNSRNKSCPRCGDAPNGKQLAMAIDAFKSGIRKAGGKIDFISWTYEHREWCDSEILSYVEHAPADCVLMQNFEDLAEQKQLGKTRYGIDYWLSYVGPSRMYEQTAQKGMECNKRIFAKMQVCCSHEVASVPYIPVPGILFKKYRSAIRLKTEGIMQCWYFGNYPSMMSKAAGMLSFMEHDLTEDAFLHQLAALYFGRSKANAAVAAWKHFEEGYKKYPLNIMVSYYGPMHDGVVWELSLLPKNYPPSRSWLLLDRPCGDRIWDSCLLGHTPEECELLTAQMCESWQKGLTLLPNLHEMKSVARALFLLFKSGHNIYKFYNLRHILGTQKGDAMQILDYMKKIVLEEIENSRRMCVLCEKDSRLGYHSEAEGYKFFPEKLQYRIGRLKELLETEFAEVKQRIKNGLPPLAYYTGAQDDIKHYTLGSGWEKIGEQSAFKASCTKDALCIELRGSNSFHIVGEFQLFRVYPEIRFEKGKPPAVICEQHWSLFGDRAQKETDKWQYTWKENVLHLSINRAAIRWTENVPFKLKIKDGEGNLWCPEENPVHTLGKDTLSPNEFGWIVFGD